MEDGTRQSVLMEVRRKTGPEPAVYGRTFRKAASQVPNIPKQSNTDALISNIKTYSGQEENTWLTWLSWLLRKGDRVITHAESDLTRVSQPVAHMRFAARKKKLLISCSEEQSNPRLQGYRHAELFGCLN